MSSKRLILVAGVLCASLLSVGIDFSCSVGNNVTSEELSKQVRTSYEDQTGILLTSIDCDEVDAEVGEAFTCDATNENEIDLKIEGRVTEAESDSDQIKFDWRVVSAAAPGESFSVAARQALRNQTGAVVDNVTCPDRIELQAGTEVDCTATDIEGNDRELTLTLTDEEGGFDVDLKPLRSPAENSAS